MYVHPLLDAVLSASYHVDWQPLLSLTSSELREGFHSSKVTYWYPALSNPLRNTDTKPKTAKLKKKKKKKAGVSAQTVDVMFCKRTE